MITSNVTCCIKDNIHPTRASTIKRHLAENGWTFLGYKVGIGTEKSAKRRVSMDGSGLRVLADGKFVQIKESIDDLERMAVS